MKHGRGGNVPACKQGRCGALFLARSGQPRSCRSGPSTTGFSRRVLVLLLPLRRQGEVGRGCPRFALIRKIPLPNPPLPSQGREPGLAAEAGPRLPPRAANAARASRVFQDRKSVV